MKLRSLLGILVAMLVVLATGGCAISTIATLIGRIGAAKNNPTSLAPSWPTDDTVALLDQSIAFGDPKVLGSMASGALKGLIATSSTGVATISPAPIAIPDVSLGGKLSVPSSFSVGIASLSIGIPPNNSTVASTSVKFTDTPAGSAKFVIPGIPYPVTLIDAKSKLGSSANLVGLPNTPSASLAHHDSSSQAIADVKDIHVSSGSVQVPMDNETAGTLTVQMEISDGAGQVLGMQTETVASHSAATSVFPLSGKLVTSPIVLDATTSGSIPAGTPLSQIDPANDQITIGPSAFSLIADYGDVHVPQQQGSNPSGTGYLAALAPVTQTFPVTSQLPAGSGITGLDSVTVASGSLTVTIVNGLAVDGNVGLAFGGIANLTSALLESNPSQPPVSIPIQNGVCTLPANASTTSILVVPLAGAVITPDASGNVTATITPSTVDSDAPPNPAPPTGSHNFVHVAQTDSLAGNVTLSPLSFQNVVGSLNASQSIATNSEPLSLPPTFTQAGISPGAITISITVANQSQLSGIFTPSIVGVASGGVAVPLVLDKTVSPPDTAFTGAFSGATTSGATQSTTLVIDQNNSNILDLLKAGASTLQVGGTVQVFGNHITISSSDQVAGQVNVVIPLELVVSPFGPGLANPPIDVRPPPPVNLGSQSTSQYTGALSSAELDVRVDNGWHFPFVLTLLLSTTSDPYSDAGAIHETLTLGSGPTALSSIKLDQQQIALLPKLATIGFQISSPGTAGQAIAVLPTDTLHVQVSARIKAQVGPQLLNQVK